MIYRDDLERVYKLIEKPENWTQGAAARDKNGDVVRSPMAVLAEEAQSPDACQWCVIGAFAKLGLAKDWEIPTEILMPEIAIGPIKHGYELGGVGVFNDTHTHAEVLQLLKDAIDRAPVRP